jgi:CRISPR-associated exonuclease Cas4
MFTEDELLPISALQHLLFCPRQCALIHLEQLWAENRLTVEGRLLHRKADAGKADRRAAGGKGKRGGGAGKAMVPQGDGVPRDGVRAGEVRTERSVAVRSFQLGLFGKTDVIEFRPGRPAVPVEYKRGKPKKDRSDVVQLCAQAMCLEEMLGSAVPAGAIFYGLLRRRVDVPFDDELRSTTRQTIDQLHEMIRTRRTPPARREKKCDRCSLVNLCLPDVLTGSESASRYLRRSLAAGVAGDGPVTETDVRD